jgi:hypothetical protein
MPGYRCYLLGEEARILALQDFYADSDDDAITMARTLSLKKKPNGFELWEGKRYVRGEALADHASPESITSAESTASAT